MVGFLKRFWRSKNNKVVGAVPRQIPLDIFQEQMRETPKRPRTVQRVPVEDLRREAEEKLRIFQSNVKEMKDLSLKMEELARLSRSGEIPKNIYNIIRAEMSSRLSELLEEQFHLREYLELAKAKAKLEWAKEKIGLKEFLDRHEKTYTVGAPPPGEMPHPSLKWERLINSIDKAFASLPIEDEVSFINQYLNMIKEKELSEDVEKSKEFCQRRLEEISKKWSSIRRDKIEEVMNLELKASEIRDEIKETEARYAVGEFEESAYESRLGALQGELRSIERKIEEIRRYIDDMDMKIFRCFETLREGS